jgi:hypothetical protein
MSSFVPTTWTLDPPDQTDQLAGVVVAALGRPMYGSLMPWGPVRSFFMGALSFGVLPLLYWPKLFGRFCISEQRQFWHLLEWLRVRHGDADAEDLQNSLNTIGPAFTLRLVPMVCLIIIAVSFAGLMMHPSLPSESWLAATYGFKHYPTRGWEGKPPAVIHLHAVWTLCLGFAFFAHWLQIREHAGNVNELVRKINRVLLRHEVPAVRAYGAGLGARPLWLAGAIVGMIAGAWWAIPAALAGGLQRQYMLRTSTRIRSELSQRVRTLLLHQRPSIDNPIARPLRVSCLNALCARPVPPGALFCPRCGSRAPDA